MDYFDEMGWEPVDVENTEHHQNLLLVRFLQENGFFHEGFNADSLAPPASKELVENLEEKVATSADEKCSICLKPNTDESQEIFKVLPCTHSFHKTCILPWLERVILHFLES